MTNESNHHIAEENRKREDKQSQQQTTMTNRNAGYGFAFADLAAHHYRIRPIFSGGDYWCDFRLFRYRGRKRWRCPEMGNMAAYPRYYERQRVGSSYTAIVRTPAYDR